MPSTRCDVSNVVSQGTDQLAVIHKENELVSQQEGQTVSQPESNLYVKACQSVITAKVIYGPIDEGASYFMQY